MVKLGNTVTETELGPPDPSSLSNSELEVCQVDGSALDYLLTFLLLGMLNDLSYGFRA